MGDCGVWGRGGGWGRGDGGGGREGMRDVGMGDGGYFEAIIAIHQLRSWFSTWEWIICVGENVVGDITTNVMGRDWSDLRSMWD